MGGTRWEMGCIARTFQSRVCRAPLAGTFTVMSPARASAMLGRDGGHEGEGGESGVEAHGGELRCGTMGRRGGVGAGKLDERLGVSDRSCRG